MNTPALISLCIRALAVVVFLVGPCPGFAQDAQKSFASIRVINPNGGRIDWGKKNDLILYDQKGPDGYYDIWVMKPNGSGKKNLTAFVQSLPQRHIGNPAWHPSGNWFVFQAQKADTPKALDEFCHPGLGILNDLYLMKADGSEFYKLRELSADVSENYPALVEPHFSPDGEWLIWSERISEEGGPFGSWTMVGVQLQFQGGRPVAVKQRVFSPDEGNHFFQAHAFAPNSESFLFTGSQHQGMEIYRYNMNSNNATRVTYAGEAWDKHAFYSPSGDKIAWASSKGLPMQFDPFVLRTEVWTMNNNGGQETRVTYFNDATHFHFLEREAAVISDLAWSPAGDKLLLYVTDRYLQNRDARHGMNILVDLNPSDSP